MGGAPVVETIRPGVQFVHDAAQAFRRAEAQVQAEFGRNLDVNSTYRSWDTQMKMYNDWNAYLAGGPRPAHSRAIHPRYSRHTGGTALDSDDWTSARIRGILAENGFIRNQLHVPNEEHHFEYIRSEDKNYGKEIDVMNRAQEAKLDRILNRVEKGLTGDRIAGAVWARGGTGNLLKRIDESVRFGEAGSHNHGKFVAASMSEYGAQRIFRASQGQGGEVDVEALAAAIAENMSQVDAAHLADAILKAAGKALSGE